MSNSNFPVPIPLGPDGGDADSAEMEVGDEVTLDPDIAADQVDSAEADRLASGAEEHDGLLGGDDPVGLL
jgi:hypothetical protein